MRLTRVTRDGAVVDVVVGDVAADGALDFADELGTTAAAVGVALLALVLAGERHLQPLLIRILIRKFKRHLGSFQTLGSIFSFPAAMPKVSMTSQFNFFPN